MTKTLIIKKAAVFILAVALICAAFLAFVGKEHSNSITYAADEENTIVLTIDSPIMSVNGEEREIDPEGGTSPVIVSGRTLVPIRAIIENMGGTVEWNSEARESILTYGEDVIRLTIDSQTAYLNDNASTLDTAPTIINGRTMLPIRFIAEGFGFNVDWNEGEKTITISEKAAVSENDTTSENTPAAQTNENTPAAQTNENAPVVYMTKDITPEALVEIY